MCVTAMVVSAVAGLAGAATAMDSARRQKHGAEDQARNAAAAETAAAQTANSRVAQRKRALATNSLLTAPVEQSRTGMAATQRATLGGG